MSAGVPDSWTYSRRARLAATAHALSRRLDVQLDKARARAAAALEPDPIAVAAHLSAAREAEAALEGGYVQRTLTHRRTGARLRVLDTEAADAPSDVQAGTREAHRYAVECATHQSNRVPFADLSTALKAARHPEDWCLPCSSLSASRPKALQRAAGYAKQERRP